MVDNSYLPSRLKNSVYENFKLPIVSVRSLSEVLTYMEGYPVMSTIDGNRTFRWYDIQGITSAFSMPVDSSDVLHVRLQDEALDFLRNEDGFLLAYMDSLEIPEEFETYRGRFMFVTDSTSEAGYNPLAMVQELFLRMLRWENQLNFQVETNAPIDDLLNVGTAMFDGFVFVVGIDDNIIGYSNGAAFPNDEYERMFREEKRISSSRFSKAIKSEVVRGRLFEVDVTQDDWGNTCVTVPVCYQGSLFGFVVHVSDRQDILPGFRDQFAHFASYVLDLCRSMLQVSVEKDMPHYYFLSSLLRGEIYTQTTIEKNLDRLGIPQNSVYKVVVLDPRESKLSARVLSNSLQSFNNWKSLVVLFNNYLVAILYEDRKDGSLAHCETMIDAETNLFEPYGVVCGFSQVFSSIRDVRLAFRQAVYALSNRASILVEKLLLNEGKPYAAISFEMVLPYFLIRENNIDEEFHEFCHSMSPLESLVKSDLENGTKDFALLWLFLSYERNASLVGRRIFMHRNSVLYNIKKIEKRFGFDLNDWYAREKLLIDYRYLFTRLSDDDLERLFDLG